MAHAGPKNWYFFFSRPDALQSLGKGKSGVRVPADWLKWHAPARPTACIADSCRRYENLGEFMQEFPNRNTIQVGVSLIVRLPGRRPVVIDRQGE